jgi:hypothetical protein
VNSEYEPMLDRRWLGDISLAVLVALPLVAFAWPQEQPSPSISAPSVSVGQPDRLPGNGRISLLG